MQCGVLIYRCQQENTQTIIDQVRWFCLKICLYRIVWSCYYAAVEFLISVAPWILLLVLHPKA